MTFYLLMISESIMVTDFFLNHLKQPLQEDGKSMNLPIDVISKKYFYGRFLFDLIALLPFGLLARFD